jgi:hypothetical protein
MWRTGEGGVVQDSEIDVKAYISQIVPLSRVSAGAFRTRHERYRAEGLERKRDGSTGQVRKFETIQRIALPEMAHLHCLPEQLNGQCGAENSDKY